MAIDWAEVRAVARDRFGVTRFRAGQRQLIEAALEGRNVLGVLPTGAGKSLCFQLPALLLPGAVVVVSPLISLMQDQQEKLAEHDVDAAKLDSTLSRSVERETEAELAHGEHELVYVTPERLEHPEMLDLLRKRKVSLFVVDEAHCVSQWGHDFRPAYLSLRDAIRALGRPPVMALTATATPEVAADVIEQLDLGETELVQGSIERENLFFEVIRTVNTEAKRDAIRRILRETEGSGILYVATVRLANELWKWLEEEGVSAARYHGKLKTKEREEIQHAFMNDEVRVVVATKAFGMGIDKPDVRFVIHYNFPDSPESYYQEAGRAGRDGKQARAVLLYRLEDKRIQSYFLGGKYPTREESARVYDGLRVLGEGGKPVKPEALLLTTELPKRRLQVIVAHLAGAGIAEKRRQGIVRVRDFTDDEELEHFLAEYEERHASDRDRLEQMMRYGSSVACRVGFLQRYFAEEPSGPCGHCDVCAAAARGVAGVHP